MFRFLQIKLNNNAAASTPHLLHLPFFSLRSLSAAISNTTNSSQTVDYLINSLGFSQELALTTAKHIDLKTLAKSDSVLALFRNYGFTQTRITSIITRVPALLLANPDKTLKPKLEFLAHNGISGRNLVDIISTDPTILGRSLEKQIIPCVDFLKSFFPTNDGIVSLFSAKRGTWVLHKFSETMGPNVDTLRRHGVPDSSITRMIVLRPRTLSRDADGFSEIVKEVKEMGFDPMSLMFIYGVCTVSGMKKDKWVSKLEVFKSFGWSEGQLRSLFVKQPKFMNSSEEQIKKALDFFMNKLDWTADDIAKYPLVLFLSFEKRIVPRSYVVQFLISKGLLKRNCMGNALMVTEDKFLKKFLVKYLEEIPQLMDMYQNKMGFL